MKLFGFLKKKKKEEPEFIVRPLVDTVLEMKRRGMSKNQIIYALQREGHPSEEVMDAIKQAELRYGVSPAPPGFSPAQFESGEPGMFGPELGPPPERTEEIVEEIVEEKWRRIADRMDLLSEWKKSQEEGLREVREDFADIKSMFEDQRVRIESEISGIRERLDELESRVGALEKGFKTFRDMLPEFTSGVKALKELSEKK